MELQECAVDGTECKEGISGREDGVRAKLGAALPNRNRMSYAGNYRLPRTTSREGKGHKLSQLYFSILFYYFILFF